MRLPDGTVTRHGLYRNTIRVCDISRDDRRTENARYRTWYLLGTETGRRARYNKLKEHVAFSSSYVYAPETVRFGIATPPKYGERWLEETQAAKKELHRLWHDSDAGYVFGTGVTWAHVWNSTIFKVVKSDGHPALKLLDPSDVGVAEEGLDDWDEQEAICHWYTLSLPKFWRLISALPK